VEPIEAAHGVNAFNCNLTHSQRSDLIAVFKQIVACSNILGGEYVCKPTETGRCNHPFRGFSDCGTGYFVSTQMSRGRPVRINSTDQSKSPASQRHGAEVLWCKYLYRKNPVVCSNTSAQQFQHLEFADILCRAGKCIRIKQFEVQAASNWSVPEFPCFLCGIGAS
jgi:hypothetical protein